MHRNTRLAQTRLRFCPDTSAQLITCCRQCALQWQACQRVTFGVPLSLMKWRHKSPMGAAVASLADSVLTCQSDRDRRRLSDRWTLSPVQNSTETFSSLETIGTRGLLSAFDVLMPVDNVKLFCGKIYVVIFFRVPHLRVSRHKYIWKLDLEISVYSWWLMLIFFWSFPSPDAFNNCDPSIVFHFLIIFALQLTVYFSWSDTSRPSIPCRHCRHSASSTLLPGEKAATTTRPPSAAGRRYLLSFCWAVSSTTSQSSCPLALHSNAAFDSRRVCLCVWH